MRISLVAVLASFLIPLGLGETAHAAHLHHGLTITNITDDVVPEPRREIHIIENANLKHVFKVNRLTGEVSECDYNPERGNLEGCAVQGYDSIPGKKGNYALENADLATAVYRVDLKTGTKTICAVSNRRVFCLATVN
jgi:hypothetical protein